MTRILLIILAVVTAILAFTFSLTILYILAGLLLLAALAIVVVERRRSHREAQPSYGASSKEEELQSLGIMEIRPKKGKASSVDQPAPQNAGASSASAASSDSTPTSSARNDLPQTTSPVKDDVRSPTDPTSEAGEEASRDPLGLFLQSLQAAIGAHTVCLLRQEEIDLKYEIESLVSRHADAQRDGHFVTKTPLVTASMTEYALTLREVGEDDLPLTSLGYYREPVPARQVAIAPVARPSDPNLYFLMADTTEPDHFEDRWRQTVLTQFAQVLETLLDRPDREESRQEPPSAKEQDVRPRREIIAEEMKHARAEGRSLALALVVLNRAEALADEGAEVVRTAERALADHLNHVASDHRLERFGELMYGIFHDGNAADVETWAARLQGDLKAATGPLEGGVSIGVAFLQDHHDTPDALRDDAAEALREAYESGACTILE